MPEYPRFFIRSGKQDPFREITEKDYNRALKRRGISTSDHFVDNIGRERVEGISFETEELLENFRSSHKAIFAFIENSQTTSEEKFRDAGYISDPENRESIKREFQEAIETTLLDFSNQTGDSNFVFEKIEVPYQLDPPVVLAMATVSSKKLQYFLISWLPSKKTLTRTMVMIREGHQGEGIGSTMNSITEEIAKKLKCSSVTVQAIIKASRDYWEKKPDYSLDKDKHSATKYL